MITKIKVEHRNRINYLAIRKEISMDKIGAELPPLVDQVADWMKSKGIKPAGPCFFQYLRMQNGILTTEVGLPVDNFEEGEGSIASGFFPEGEYAVCTYFGEYSGLHAAHMELDKWVSENGFREKHKRLTDGCEWGTRAEWYINDCQLEPDPGKWQTDISFLLEKVSSQESV